MQDIQGLLSTVGLSVVLIDERNVLHQTTDNILCYDISNNQNVWGPGIILARRVMDLGDSFHILLADKLAEELIGLKDEYRTVIKYVADYQVKHGQRIKLYSAFSKEFGNPQSPAKVVDQFYKSP